MSGFIRPELRAEIIRQWQTLTGLVVALLGLWVALNTFGVVRWFGWGIVIAGVIVAIDGYRRARFARVADGQGAGLVEIDERQISWFGAHWGGSVSIDELSRVEIESDPTRGAVWIFTQKDGQRLVVPANCPGAEGVADALSPLAGFDFDSAANALARPAQGRILLWQAVHNRVENLR